MITKEQWMEYALIEAERASTENEVPVGSIITKENRIIGRGFNKMESLKDCTAHSEIIAITSASNSLNDWRLNDCSIYVTKEPCIMCFGAILNSRINRLYFGMNDNQNGFRYSLGRNLKSYSKHLDVISAGVLEDRCKSVIQLFFKNKRNNNNK